VKGENDQMQKGFKPPILKNITQVNKQGKSAQNEHKTTYSFGKRPRQ
jgi:hypothetical protein